MPRHACKRDIRVFVAAGERYSQNIGSFYRVIEKHFVKIAHAEKEDRVAVLFLYFKILTHSRCFHSFFHRGFCWHVYSLISDCGISEKPHEFYDSRMLEIDSMWFML